MSTLKGWPRVEYEADFVLTQERIDNVEAHCVSIEKDMAEYMERNPKGTDQWLEERVRALEEQVKILIACTVHLRTTTGYATAHIQELRDAKRTEANIRRDAAHDIPTSDI